MPASPKTIAKRGWRVIKSNVASSKAFILPTSPARSLRKHVYAVSFGNMPRDAPTENECPVHSYSDPISTLKRSGTATFGKDTTARRGHLVTEGPEVHNYAEPPSSLKRSGATAFSKDTTARRGYLATDGPATHSYADPVTTLKRTGATAFSQDKTERAHLATNGPPVHNYAEPISMLKRTGTATFGKAMTARRGFLATDGPATHAYADPLSTLKRTGATAFSKSTLERDESIKEGAATSVHAYMAPLSTLKSSGVAPFGRAKPQGQLTNNTNTPRPTMRGFERATEPQMKLKPPKTVPKLIPLRAPSPVSVGDELEGEE